MTRSAHHGKAPRKCDAACALHAAGTWQQGTDFADAIRDQPSFAHLNSRADAALRISVTVPPGTIWPEIDGSAIPLWKECANVAEAAHA